MLFIFFIRLDPRTGGQLLCRTTCSAWNLYFLCALLPELASNPQHPFSLGTKKGCKRKRPVFTLSDSILAFLSRLRVLFSPSPFRSFSRVMGDYAEFRDWEVLDFDAGEDHMKILHERACGGSILSDYFALGAQERCRKGATFNGNAHEEEMIEAAALVDSKSPNWVDPEPNSQFLDKAKEDVGFRGTEFSPGDFGGLRSHESSDEQRSDFGGEKGELGGAEAFEVGDIVHGDDGADKEVVSLGIGEKPVEEAPQELVKNIECLNSSVEMTDNDGGAQKKLLLGTHKRVMVWWKFPFELIRFCAFRVKPFWSFSIAAAVLGVWMLGKRLSDRKHKTRSIPLNVPLDVKRGSQMKIQATRLNEAFSVLRQSPILRAPLHPTSGLTSWSVVSLQ
ncbi:hypothetical protein ZIOFF_019788 [Zingiber officinale]|uniref:DUF6821 domain-containing protein n=1 Tax=Zingiber officinale TaxID=94328 RepID=A0A8J5LBW2_ZINOF|nr:hypothetical protein ZIOFF_019788 [Zingiber officinale]